MKEWDIFIVYYVYGICVFLCFVINDLLFLVYVYDFLINMMFNDNFFNLCFYVGCKVLVIKI